MSAASTQSRRLLISSLAAAAAVQLFDETPAVWASGGATAGKYTTIPIAKRRYFGRVKQGVYEFNLMESAIAEGNLRSPSVTNFFDISMVVTSARSKRNCATTITFGSECKVKETKSSRYDDMKLTMYLLGNAFRLDSGKSPEKVKQVRQAKGFFSEVTKVEKAVEKNDKMGAALHYALAREALDVYLNDVELPPSLSGEYNQEADQEVPSLCQGSFCI